MELPTDLNSSITKAISLLDSMSAGLAAIGPDYRYIAFNTAHREVVRRSLGIDIQAGDHYLDTNINSKIIRDLEEEVFRRVLNGENIQRIVDFGNVGQYRGRYNVNYNPIYGETGHVAGITIFSQDISEYAALQKENAETTHLLNSIAANLPVALFRCDPDGTVTLSIGAALKKIGLTDNQLAGHNIHELYPDKIDILNRVMNQKETLQFETETPGLEGPLCFYTIMYPDEYNEGGLVGFSMDITENKDAERALIDAKVIAEEAAEAKHKFLSNMSHEIRTPINGIIGLTNLLIQELPGEEKLNLLKFSAETLLALVNDILDYSKIQSGKISFEEIPFNLSGLINSIKLSHDLLAREKGIRFRIRRDVEVPDIVVGDPVRLTQILNNLISNAMKFTSKGSVTMDVSLNEMTETNVDIDFSIEDTGIGIEDAMKEYIFESFTQANADTTRLFGGTGLGLAITRQLLRLQHSDIELVSTPGQGSTFSFCLSFKRAQHEAHIDPAKETADMLQLAGRKVLLVEDNEINRIVAIRFMQNWQMDVGYATTGDDAVNKVKGADYEIILMDLQMPKLDGYEASKQIRQLGIETPIIALTASVMPEIKDKVIEAGMNDYMTKPFVPERLFNILARYLIKSS
jgi:signal transduction histidine kinase/BarA-like signal transduction histidine kinase